MEDVNHRIQTGWMKWRNVSGVNYDRKVPLKLKRKFYYTTIKTWKESIGKKVRVAPIVEKMVKSCLRWFVHIGENP